MVTANIETLKKGDYVLSRDQDAPDGPLVGMPITRKYRRVADHLQVLDVEDAGGTPQTIHTTDEHPFFVPSRRWTMSKLLETGDGLLGPAEIGSNVTGNVRQTHPTGVVVYNMEVAGSHTYFVRAEDSDAEPVWVHNAGQGYLFPEMEADASLAKSSVGRNRDAGNAVRDAIAAREQVANPSALVRAEESFYLGSQRLERRLDVVVRGQTRIGIESKVGATSLTPRVRQELARDIRLLRNGVLDQISWEFSRSAITGEVGPSAPLLQKLNSLQTIGIRVRIN